ncbi:MAG: hypothetical protein RJA47_1775 [Actinomycetota bacterium]|jgi:disulfide bond formation protein DsbB
MNTEAVQMFSALLALGATAGLAVLIVGVTVASGSGFGSSLLVVVRENAMRFSLLLAGTAMVGSLYFSEAANYAPCKLCWYQRVCMYPIAIVSLVAVVRRESAPKVRTLAPYVLTLSVLGMLVSTYHYVLEWYPQLETSVCSLDVPCTTVWFREFGFLTLSGMAWVAFAAVTAVMLVVLRSPEDSGAAHTTQGG